uniref:GLIPR1-like protein 1 isoform X1 n=1 Tax=Styela clava TaxID=7725 RepID=UPI001939A750|nr:GLIPR1-like protein 1 isoform X1 [Styela clava]
MKLILIVSFLINSSIITAKILSGPERTLERQSKRTSPDTRHEKFIHHQDVDNNEIERKNCDDERDHFFGKLVKAKWDINPPKLSVKKSALKKGYVFYPVKFSKIIKQGILAAHNHARVHFPASNMKLMTWDRGLEKMAIRHTRECLYSSSAYFHPVGENVFASTGLPYSEGILERVIDLYYTEKANYDFENLRCKKGKTCQHFLQVIWAKSSRVGCGATLCRNLNVHGKIWDHAFYFTCNYAPVIEDYNTKPYLLGPHCSRCDPAEVCRYNLCTKLSTKKSALQ